MKKVFAATAFTAVIALAASPALADRPPNDGERAALERVLRANGFASWDEIELDDDGPRWEIDDARTANGQRYDVKIDPRTLRIVRRERDN